MMPEQDLIFKQPWASLKTGYEYDAVFSRSFKIESPHEAQKIRKLTSHTQLGVLTLNLADRAELFGSLGSMASTLDTSIHHQDVEYKSDTHFAWSIGGRVLFAYWGNLQFGLSASYLHFFPRVHAPPMLNPSYKDLDYTEWQVGAGISYHFGWLYPYIGTKYSQARAKYFHARHHLDDPSLILKSKKIPGLVIGCGLAPERGIAFNVEGRFIDETALTASVDIKF